MLLAVVVVVVVIYFKSNEVKPHNPREKGDRKSKNPHSFEPSFCGLLYLVGSLIFGNRFILHDLAFDTNDQILHRSALENSDVKCRYTRKAINCVCDFVPYVRCLAFVCVSVKGESCYSEQAC